MAAKLCGPEDSKAQGVGERATVVKDGILRFGVESALRWLLCRFVDEIVNSAHFEIRHYMGAAGGRIRHFTQRRGELAHAASALKSLRF